MAKKKKFVSQEEAEVLAHKHIENYLNECNLQSIDDAKLASQKLVAVALDCMDQINNGTAEKLAVH